MPFFNKTSVLLDRVEWADSPFGGYVSFGGEPDVGVGIVWLDRQAWEDMGSPVEVTVTVEAGDTMNGAV